jgi:hypothetical protein
MVDSWIFIFFVNCNFFGVYFSLSQIKIFILGQISSSLKSFENLNSEIQNLKKEISKLKRGN